MATAGLAASGTGTPGAGSRAENSATREMWSEGYSGAGRPQRRLPRPGMTATRVGTSSPPQSYGSPDGPPDGPPNGPHGPGTLFKQTSVGRTAAPEQGRAAAASSGWQLLGRSHAAPVWRRSRTSAPPPSAEPLGADSAAAALGDLLPAPACCALAEDPRGCSKVVGGAAGTVARGVYHM